MSRLIKASLVMAFACVLAMPAVALAKRCAGCGSPYIGPREDLSRRDKSLIAVAINKQTKLEHGGQLPAALKVVASGVAGEKHIFKSSMYGNDPLFFRDRYVFDFNAASKPQGTPGKRCIGRSALQVHGDGMFSYPTIVRPAPSSIARIRINQGQKP